jgi:competence protein ComEA
MGQGMRMTAAWRAVMVGGAVLGLLGAGLMLWRVGTTPSPAETVAADAMAARTGRQAVPGTAAVAGTTSSTRMVLVHVSGAVASPGLYRLASGLRVGDAIAAAGGLLPDADPDRLPNLAGRLTDGRQIKVARLKAGSNRAAPKVDINSADLAQLEAVPGIDAALAQAILDYREDYGPFASVTELKTALGLDTATLSAIRKYLTAL